MDHKAIIFDIQRGSLRDGPGIRTTIFLKGCPLNCLWCHNPEATTPESQLFFYYDKCKHCGDCVKVCPNDVHQFNHEKHSIDYDKCKLCGKCVEECNSNALKIVGAEMSVDEVMLQVMADLDFYKNSGGGMTLSGGEPMFQFAFSMELLKKCRKKGVHTCIETSGHAPAEQFGQILPYVDVLLFDYKLTGSDSYKKYTGVPDKQILKNLDLAYKYGASIILRCPIIPGINDTDQHFNAICALDKKYPDLEGIELLPYHTMGNSKRISIGINETLIDLKTTPPGVPDRWLEKLKKSGCEKAIVN